MASSQPTVSDLEKVTIRLKEEITSKFSELHRALDERKSVLLGELDRIINSIETNPEIEAAIQQLKKFREEGLKLLTSNLIPDNSNIQSIDKQIFDLQKKLPDFSLINSYQVRQNKSWLFSEAISDIQLISSWDYPKRKDPILKLYNKGSGAEELSKPLDICIDKFRNEIYVADSSNSRICIFNLNYEFSRVFNEAPINSPRGIDVTLDFVFVANNINHSISKYDLNGNLLIQKGEHGDGKEKFNSPISLKSCKDLIYVCDSYNNRIQVLDFELNFSKFIAHSDLKRPTDIKIFPDNFIVLTKETNSIFQFSLTSGDYMHSISLSGQENPIKEAFFFALDEQNNFLVSDKLGGCVKVFSHEGELKQIIGKGHLHYPRGIAVTSDSRIILACENERGCFQVY